MLQALPSAPSLIDRTYQQLLVAISDGSLAPGQRITQSELADSLGVSRQPISHALHLLKRQGLVEDSGRKGFRVAALDLVRIRQLYEMREVIDGLSARLAAIRRDGRNALTGLAELVRTGLAFGPMTEIPVLVRADTEFHRGLYALSGNPAIGEMTEPLWPHLMRSMAAVLVTPGYAVQVWREHAAILDQIQAGNPDAAEHYARAHARCAATRTNQRLAA